MSATGPLTVALAVIAALDELGLRYLVGGSVAGTVFGEPRTTLDTDLVVELGFEDVDSLAERLEGEFYLDRVLMREAVDARRSFNLIHLATTYKVDVFVPPAEGLHLVKWERRRLIRLQEDLAREVWITDPECLVLQKLDWHRAGGGVSDQQWRDILGILKVQGSGLDLEFLRHWGGELGLEADLERALAEAGSGP